MVALALVPLLLSACGGSPPATAHATPPALLPALDRAIHQQVAGHYAKAVVGFLGVVKEDPKAEIAWYDLGAIAGLEHQDTLAARDYRSAIRADPSYAAALYNLAVLEAPKDPGAAAHLYEKVVALQPRDATAHLNLGFALLALGRSKEGKAQLARAIALDPAMAAKVPVAGGGTA